jgi:hypothetical protein
MPSTQFGGSQLKNGGHEEQMADYFEEKTLFGHLL